MSSYWKNRALSAEKAVRYVLWATPYPDEKTSKNFADRIHAHMEIIHPDQVVRYDHRKIDVYKEAEFCGCSESDPYYDEWHSESSEDGEYLCLKSFLGYVCEFCENKDGDGPLWRPESIEWPCRVIQDLDAKMGYCDGDMR